MKTVFAITLTKDVEEMVIKTYGSEVRNPTKHEMSVALSGLARASSYI